MIKRISGVLVFLAALLPALAFAGEKKSKEETEKEWGEKVKEICLKVEELRGLEFKKKVGVGMKTEEELVEFLLKSFEEEMPDSKFEAIQLAYARMGLLPDDMNLKKTYVDMMTSQVGGFYNPKTRKLFVIDRKGSKGKKKDPMTAMMEAGLKMFGLTMDDLVAAHELTHALQDQHFGLENIEKDLAGNDDRLMALKCVIEGDATIMMMEYLYDKVPFAKNQGGMRDMGSMAQPLGPGMEKVPEILKVPLVYPYIGGAALVDEAKKRGGWKAVDEMFANPPLSSEQVLHLDKYFKDRDDPTAVDFDEVSKLPGSGCEVLECNVLGELGLRLWLGEGLKKKESEKAAEGWDGDRFAAYRKDGRIFYFLFSTWDSDEEGMEFAKAARDRIVKKTGQPVVVQDTTGMKGEDWKWTGLYKDDSSLVEVRGSDVVIIEGIVNEEALVLCDQLFKRVKKSQVSATASPAPAADDGRIKTGEYSLRPPEGWKSARSDRFERTVLSSVDGNARLEVGVVRAGRSDASELADDLKAGLQKRLARFQLLGSGGGGGGGESESSLEFEGEDPVSGNLCKWEMTVKVRKGRAVIATFVAPKRGFHRYRRQAEEALESLEIE